MTGVVMHFFKVLVLLFLLVSAFDSYSMFQCFCCCSQPSAEVSYVAKQEVIKNSEEAMQITQRVSPLPRINSPVGKLGDPMHWPVVGLKGSEMKVHIPGIGVATILSSIRERDETSSYVLMPSQSQLSVPTSLFDDVSSGSDNR